MARFLHHDMPRSSRKFYCPLLAFFWTSGLASGIWAWFLSGEFITPLMRSSAYGSVSIVSLLCVTGLPFLLSAFAVFLSSEWLLIPIAFGKGFFFSLISMGTTVSFGCAGWLVRLLLCFSDIVSIPLLYWFWVRCLRNDGSRLIYLTFFTGALFLLIGSVDYYMITPFLADLIIL